MNGLCQMIRQSLRELERGIAGQLNLTEELTELSSALHRNQVYRKWRVSYPTQKHLAAWFADLCQRASQLHRWIATGTELLPSTWISGLSQPGSFLTSVMQATARTEALPLEVMVLQTIFERGLGSTMPDTLPETGVYIHGLYMEGAGFEDDPHGGEGYITQSLKGSLRQQMPVAHVISVHIDQMSWTHMYHCPLFVTSERLVTWTAATTYVTTVNVRMRPEEEEHTWILAGAALLLTDD